MRFSLRILFTVSVLGLALLLQNGCGESHEEQPDAADARAADDIPRGQLPDSVRPLRYRLDLAIDPDQPRFSGHVEIDAELAEAADGIWLHGKDLNVRTISVRGADGSDRAAGYRQMTDEGVARVSFDDVLAPGPVTLVFDYDAPFNENLDGLYRISVGGRNYATTQFEATSARLAFPGFDEPRFKVPFDVTLEVNEGAKAVTNTPAVAEEAAGEGSTRVRFAETRPLPTYLIAFVVGPWDERAGDPIAKSPLREQAIPLRAFAAVGKGDELEYALSRTGEIVAGLEDYFGIAYPYEKLDIIAVPDFAAGAMENAGAITYREQLLLFGPDASILLKQGFASVDAHELSHQWFGDLVTPKWWNDIWLNEAFATWMAAKTMQRIEPDQGYALRRVAASLEVMRQDALTTARRIRQPIVSHSDIGAAFDGITYQKGAAVLAMLERFVGEDNFRRGIHDYLQAHRFGNADAREFVQAIAATRSDLPDGQVEKAFFSFLEQPGTPLVSLDWTCPTGGGARVSVDQARYLPVGSHGDADREWLLPLCVAYGSSGERKEQCELIDGQSSSFPLDSATCPDYVMPNADAAGYYRFDLSNEHWTALLSASRLTDEEQLAVAAALSGAFHAGRLSVGEYLALIPRLLDSDNVEVVTAPIDDLKWIHDRLLTKENQARLRRVLADYYSEVAARVPLDARPSGAAPVQLQSEMARLYGLLIDAPDWRRELTREAVAYLDAQVESGSHRAEAPVLPGNLRETAFTVAVEEQGQPFAERLLTLFRRSSDAQLRQEILRALDHGADEPMLERLRELALTEEVRDNEVENVLGPQMAEADSRDAAWRWLMAHFDAVAERVPYWFRGGIVAYGADFCSNDRADEIERDLGDKVRALGGGPRSLAETVEQIQLCEALHDSQEDAANTQVGNVGGRT